MAPAAIRSRTNPLLRRLRRIRADGGRADGLALLEGPKLVAEAIGAGVEIVEAAASPRGRERAAPLLDTLEGRGTRVRQVDEALLASFSPAETSQGVLALARRPRFEEASLYVGLPLVVVAVAIQNPGNLGALLRTAEAAGASGALLTTGCADPFSWKALRGAMGSAFRLPHLTGLTLVDALRRLQARGLPLAATATSGGTPYDRADLSQPLGLLFGSEGAGLTSEVMAQADVILTVPLAPRVESLNVGVAAGILLFEAARQRRSRAAAVPG
jgi:TrmH family RNA methyltransferase